MKIAILAVLAAMTLAGCAADPSTIKSSCFKTSAGCKFYPLHELHANGGGRNG